MILNEIYNIIKANCMPLADIQFSAYSEDNNALLDIDFIYYNNKKNIVVVVCDSYPELTSDDKIIYISDDIKHAILSNYVEDKLYKLLHNPSDMLSRHPSFSFTYYIEHLSASLYNSVINYVNSNLAYHYRLGIEHTIERNNNWICSIENNMQELIKRRKKIQSSSYKRTTTNIDQDGKLNIIYDSCTLNDKPLSISEELTFIDKALSGGPKQIDSIKAENVILTEELSKIKEVTE